MSDLRLTVSGLRDDLRSELRVRQQDYDVAALVSDRSAAGYASGWLEALDLTINRLDAILNEGAPHAHQG